MNILEIQLLLKSETKYSKTYLKICESAQLSNRVKLKKLDENYVYYEQHHILPKSLFSEFDNLKVYKWNSTLLTPKEHFICHLLIWKHYKSINYTYGEIKMSKAIKMLNGVSVYNSKNYEILKLNLSHSDKTKLKMSESAKGRIPVNKGIAHSDKTKLKMSESAKNRVRKKSIKIVFTEEQLLEKRNVTKEKHLNREIVKCPYCKKEGKINGMKQWHFEYCQENPDRLIHEVRPKQIIVECPHCKKTGQKSAMLRWHFDKCKFFTLSNNS